MLVYSLGIAKIKYADAIHHQNCVLFLSVVQQYQLYATLVLFAKYVIKMCPFVFNLVLLFLFCACSHIATPLVSLLFATLLICVIGAVAGVQESPRYAGISTELKLVIYVCLN